MIRIIRHIPLNRKRDANEEMESYNRRNLTYHRFFFNLFGI